MNLTRNQIKAFIKFPFFQFAEKQLNDNMFWNLKLTASSKQKEINKQLGEKSQYVKFSLRDQLRDWHLRVKSKSSQNVFDLESLNQNDIFEHKMNYSSLSMKAKKNIIQNVTLFENGNQLGSQMDGSLELKYNNHYKNVLKMHLSHQWNWFTEEIRSIQNINLQNDLRVDYVQDIGNDVKAQFSINDLLIKNRKTRGFINDTEDYQLNASKFFLLNNMTRIHINDFPVMKNLSNQYYRQLNPMVYINTQLMNNGQWYRRASLGFGLNIKYEEVGLELSYILAQSGPRQTTNGLAINLIG